MAKHSNGPKPPRTLGPHGLRLWNAVHGAYAIDDVGGLELLCLACQALDRAERCREAIDRDGEMVAAPNGGLKSNPLLRDELANRAFIARTLDRPSNVGWQPPPSTEDDGIDAKNPHPH